MSCLLLDRFHIYNVATGLKLFLFITHFRTCKKYFGTLCTCTCKSASSTLPIQGDFSTQRIRDLFKNSHHREKELLHPRKNTSWNTQFNIECSCWQMVSLSFLNRYLQFPEGHHKWVLKYLLNSCMFIKHYKKSACIYVYFILQRAASMHGIIFIFLQIGKSEICVSA